MSEKFPEEEELVVATVESITRFGAYLKLEDYPYTAFLPISEVSTRWVRRITDVIRQGQRVVVKVIRVDKRTQSIDVSLKEVPSSEARKVLMEWEKNRKGEKLLASFSQKIGINLDELYEKLSQIIEKAPTIYDALERIVIDPNLLDAVELQDEIKEKLLAFLSSRVRPREYVFRAIVSASCKDSNGVEKIKKFFSELEKEAKRKGLKIEITLIASPKYLVRISSYRPEQIKKYATPIIASGNKIAQKTGITYQVLEEALEK